MDKTRFILILGLAAFRLFAQPALPTTNQMFAPIANPYSGSWIFYTTNSVSGLGFLNGASIPYVMTASNNFVTYVNTATNGLVTSAITNGLATTNFVTSQGYVTASVTNGLATTASLNTASNVVLQAATNSSAATAITLIATATNGLVTSAITNGLATIAYVNTATNGLVTAGITNGLATTNFVLSQGYATATVTNGLATIAYVNTATNGLVTAGITNGLATIGYDNFGTNFLGTNDLAQLNSASNVLAGKIISATNGLATTNYVASQGYAAVKTIWAGTSGGTAVLANKTVFWPPNNSSSTATLTDGAGTGTRVPVPETITLTNLYLIISAAPGGSHTNTFAIMTNGVASPLTVMIFNTGITATNNTTASVTIPAGTEIGVKITTQSGATTANWEWTFEGR